MMDRAEILTRVSLVPLIFLPLILNILNNLKDTCFKCDFFDASSEKLTSKGSKDRKNSSGFEKECIFKGGDLFYFETKGE